MRWFLKEKIKVCRSGAGGSDPVVVSALRSGPRGSPCVRVPPRGAPKPSFIFSFLFSLALCVSFSLFSLGLFSFCLAVKICTFTLQIVNSKNCILNFYMREEEPTSIYIYINISIYIYTYKYI